MFKSQWLMRKRILLAWHNSHFVRGRHTCKEPPGIDSKFLAYKRDFFPAYFPGFLPLLHGSRAHIAILGQLCILAKAVHRDSQSFRYL